MSTAVRTASGTATLVDRFMPVYDLADSAATLVRADARTTWDALTSVDLIEVGRRRPMMRLLGALRTLPDVASRALHHQDLPAAPTRLRLHDLAETGYEEGGWTLLGQLEGKEIALGAVGKFWLPVIDFADVQAEEFRDFSDPGYAKRVYSLSVSRLDAKSTLLRAEVRVATTDERARRWFRRYWTFGVGYGAHVLITGLIDEARNQAESRRLP